MSVYNLNLKFDGKHYKASGETVLDGLNKLLKHDLITAKGVLTIKRGKKKFEIVMYPRLVRRLMVNKVSRQLFDKRVSVVLK